MMRMILEMVKKNMPEIKKAILEELKKDAEFRQNLREALGVRGYEYANQEQ